jgi:hypothetical protein
MIALNLLLVFVFDFSDTKRIEPVYYAGPFVLATILVTIPAAQGIYYNYIFE